MTNDSNNGASIKGQATFFENIREIKLVKGSEQKQLVAQEPRVAKLAVFEATAGTVRVNLTINVFLSASSSASVENMKMIDKFQMVLAISESPTAALYTGESINTFSFSSLVALEAWWKEGQADLANFISMAFGKTDAAVVDKVKYVFQDFISDRKFLEDEAAAAHTKFTNRERKGARKKISHSHS